jgi:mRNA-degrading endonuclease RelE of RelBE toxin-antitoxin system
MAWTIIYSRRAERDLESLSESLRAVVLLTISRAAGSPASVSLAKSKGRPGEWRIRTGGWRIIVELDNRAGAMTVLRILPRKDAYR